MERRIKQVFRRELLRGRRILRDFSLSQYSTLGALKVQAEGNEGFGALSLLGEYAGTNSEIFKMIILLSEKGWRTKLKSC